MKRVALVAVACCATFTLLGCPPATAPPYGSPPAPTGASGAALLTVPTGASGPGAAEDVKASQSQVTFDRSAGSMTIPDATPAHAPSTFTFPGDTRALVNAYILSRRSDSVLVFAASPMLDVILGAPADVTFVPAQTFPQTGIVLQTIVYGMPAADKATLTFTSAASPTPVAAQVPILDAGRIADALLQASDSPSRASIVNGVDGKLHFQFALPTGPAPPN